MPSGFALGQSLGPRGAKSLLRQISRSSGGRIFQYIPPLGSVLFSHHHQGVYQEISSLGLRTRFFDPLPRAAKSNFDRISIHCLEPGWISFTFVILWIFLTIENLKTALQSCDLTIRSDTGCFFFKRKMVLSKGDSLHLERRLFLSPGLS